MTTESNNTLTGIMTYLDDNKEDMKSGHYCELAGLIVKAQREMEEQVSKSGFYKLTYIIYEITEGCWSGETTNRKFEITNDTISRIFKAEDVTFRHLNHSTMIPSVGDSFALDNDKVSFVDGYDKINKHFYRLDAEANFNCRGNEIDEDETDIAIEVPNPILIAIEKL